MRAAVADLLVMALGRNRFTWGGGNFVDAGETSRRYIAALQAADAHVFDFLIAFARS